MIPLCDVKQQYWELKDDIDAALISAATEGRYILGPNARQFEQEVADYCGSKFAVGVGNGTDALYLVLRALDVGPGDEVITTPFTFIATAEAISLVGATPVFVDIDLSTFNIDVGQIEAAITGRTRALLPVHLYGQPCNMEAIRSVADRHQLAVVEDCAQAFGATYQGQKVGTLGIAGCYSFFPSKNLGAMGDAGMIVTNDDTLYERVEMLRRHGGRVKYHHEEPGVNSRLDELQAAVLRIKLKRIDAWNQMRRERAWSYNELLAEFPWLRRPGELSQEGTTIPLGATVGGHSGAECVYHQYTVLLENRDEVMDGLKAQGIGCLVYYPRPLHLQEVYADLGHTGGDFPNAEHAARHCLSLPMFPHLSVDQQRQVVEALEIASNAQDGSAQRKAA